MDQGPRPSLWSMCADLLYRSRLFLSKASATAASAEEAIRDGNVAWEHAKAIRAEIAALVRACFGSPEPAPA
ncbi:hypothetical protein [Streptomyces sp. NPDC057287]|uniref:hypothetical protein n=1 Tax=Streptomyces sp. NPDC057287 TaxID=3346086 RepID=UPI0036289674